MVASAGEAGVSTSPGADTICQQPVLRPPADVATEEGGDVFDDDDEVFDDPLHRAAARPAPRYKPGTRQLPAQRDTATADGSWWMRPDADWQAEATRMSNNPKAMNVPGQNNILCMHYGREAKGGGAW